MITLRHLTARRLNTPPSLKMLCSRGLQSPLSPFMDHYWPVRSLWPEVRPLLFQRDLRQRHMQDLHSRLELMDKLQHIILEEVDHVPAASVAIQPVSYQLDGEGEHFSLTLDTKDFSPEELSVKQVGRKLRVSGRTEKKQDDGKGSYSYRCQEFRQEFDLPEGVNPEQISCSLDNGQLQIQAPQQQALTNQKERVVPISFSPAPASTPALQSSGSGGHTPIPVENETKKD